MTSIKTVFILIIFAGWIFVIYEMIKAKATFKFNEEILNGISKLNVTYDDFEHNLEDNNYTYAYHTYIFETANYMVTLELCETAVWESYDYYETNNLEVENLIVENQDGVVECTLTDEEILKHINY